MSCTRNPDQNSPDKQASDRKPAHKWLLGGHSFLHRAQRRVQLAEKVSSLGGRGFSPGVKLLQPMGFRAFCVRRFLAEALKKASWLSFRSLFSHVEKVL
jgi:hypothetical protein